MQTFLPYPDFQRTADVLDPVRRWKQVVESRQLIRALEQGPLCRYDLTERKFVYGPVVSRRPPAGAAYRTTPWYSHPACRMWRGRVDALKLYHNVLLVTIYRLRTHRVTAFGLYDLMDYRTHVRAPIDPPMPSWLGRRDFHAAHRSGLLRKFPIFYGRWGWDESDDLEYVWPNP